MEPIDVDEVMRVKIAVVGEPLSGKTTIINAFCGKTVMPSLTPPWPVGTCPCSTYDCPTVTRNSIRWEAEHGSVCATSPIYHSAFVGMPALSRCASKEKLRCGASGYIFIELPGLSSGQEYNEQDESIQIRDHDRDALVKQMHEDALRTCDFVILVWDMSTNHQPDALPVGMVNSLKVLRQGLRRKIDVYKGPRIFVVGTKADLAHSPRMSLNVIKDLVRGAIKDADHTHANTTASSCISVSSTVNEGTAQKNISDLGTNTPETIVEVFMIDALQALDYRLLKLHANHMSDADVDAMVLRHMDIHSCGDDASVSEDSLVKNDGGIVDEAYSGDDAGALSTHLGENECDRATDTGQVLESSGIIRLENMLETILCQYGSRRLQGVPLLTSLSGYVRIPTDENTPFLYTKAKEKKYWAYGIAIGVTMISIPLIMASGFVLSPLILVEGGVMAAAGTVTATSGVATAAVWGNAALKGSKENSQALFAKSEHLKNIVHHAVDARDAIGRIRRTALLRPIDMLEGDMLGKVVEDMNDGDGKITNRSSSANSVLDEKVDVSKDKNEESEKKGMFGRWFSRRSVSVEPHVQNLTDTPSPMSEKTDRHMVIGRGDPPTPPLTRFWSSWFDRDVKRSESFSLPLNESVYSLTDKSNKHTFSVPESGRKPAAHSDVDLNRNSIVGVVDDESVNVDTNVNETRMLERARERERLAVHEHALELEQEKEIECMRELTEGTDSARTSTIDSQARTQSEQDFVVRPEAHTAHTPLSQPRLSLNRKQSAQEHAKQEQVDDDESLEAPPDNLIIDYEIAPWNECVYVYAGGFVIDEEGNPRYHSSGMLFHLETQQTAVAGSFVLGRLHGPAVLYDPVTGKGEVGAMFFHGRLIDFFPLTDDDLKDNLSGEPEFVVEELFQHQRYYPVAFTWREPHLPGDPEPWSDACGEYPYINPPSFAAQQEAQSRCEILSYENIHTEKSENFGEAVIYLEDEGTGDLNTFCSGKKGKNTDTKENHRDTHAPDSEEETDLFRSWVWVGPWHIHVDDTTDAHGWRYASDFSPSTKKWSSLDGKLKFCRRRKWVRKRKRRELGEMPCNPRKEESPPASVVKLSFPTNTSPKVLHRSTISLSILLRPKTTPTTLGSENVHNAHSSREPSPQDFLVQRWSAEGDNAAWVPAKRDPISAKTVSMISYLLMRKDDPMNMNSCTEITSSK
eukprot:CFRG8514T1